MSRIIPPAEERFRHNINELLSFMSSLITAAIKNGYDGFDVVLLENVADLIKEETDSKNIVRGFIRRSVKLWDNVLSNDINFFKNNAMLIFGEVDSDTVNIVKKLFTTNDIYGRPKFVSAEDEEDLFEMCGDLIRVSISYIHDNNYELLMLHQHLPEGFDYKMEAKKWNVPLK